MDSNLLMECVEDELEPWQWFDDDVQEDGMVQEADTMVMEVNDNTPVTVSVQPTTMDPVVSSAPLPTGASLVPAGMAPGQKLILTQTPAGLGTILLPALNPGEHPAINQPIFLTTEGFPVQTVGSAQSTVSPLRLVLNMQQAAALQPFTLLTGPPDGQFFRPTLVPKSEPDEVSPQPGEVSPQLQRPQVGATPALAQPSTFTTVKIPTATLTSQSALASGATLTITTTTTDTRPTAAPTDCTPDLTSHTETAGPPDGQFFRPTLIPKSEPVEVSLQPGQVSPQLQRPQVGATSALAQPSITLTTIKIPDALTSQSALASGATLTITTTTTDPRPTAAPTDCTPDLTSHTETELGPDHEFKVEDTVDETVVETPGDLHGILRQESISRLITKLESALSRTPLDLDFLEFTCRQELYLWEALSKHVNVPPEIIQAVQEFLWRLMAHVEHADVEAAGREIGRPRHNIEKERLVELLDINLPVDCIAKLLSVSTATVIRRLREFGLPAKQSLSNVTDQQLDAAVQHIVDEMPTAGYRKVKGRLGSMGIHALLGRVAASMHRVDSVGLLSRLAASGLRTTYSVRGPLSMWHVDTNHKLIRYNIVLFGAVDCYSRKVMCLEAATDNQASTAFAAFKRAVERHGIPSRVRGDEGAENEEIARYMRTIWGNDRGSFLSGKSFLNHRIQCLWRDVWTCVTSKYSNALQSLETDNLLDASSRDLFSVHRAFLPRLRADLQAFVKGWNQRPVGPERNETPEQLWNNKQHIHPPEEDEDIEEPDIDWDVAAGYGGDVDGVLAVPELECPLNEEQLAKLQQLIDRHGEKDTRTLYLRCRRYLDFASSGYAFHFDW